MAITSTNATPYATSLAFNPKPMKGFPATVARRVWAQSPPVRPIPKAELIAGTAFRPESRALDVWDRWQAIRSKYYVDYYLYPCRPAGFTLDAFSSENKAPTRRCYLKSCPACHTVRAISCCNNLRRAIVRLKAADVKFSIVFYETKRCRYEKDMWRKMVTKGAYAMIKHIKLEVKDNGKSSWGTSAVVLIDPLFETDDFWKRREISDFDHKNLLLACTDMLRMDGKILRDIKTIEKNDFGFGLAQPLKRRRFESYGLCRKSVGARSVYKRGHAALPSNKPKETIVCFE